MFILLVAINTLIVFQNSNTKAMCAQLKMHKESEPSIKENTVGVLNHSDLLPDEIVGKLGRPLCSK